MARNVLNFIAFLAQVVFGLYMAVAGIVFMPYFSWQHVRQQGFLEWFLLGETVPAAKALTWPYWVLDRSSNSNSSSARNEWSEADIENSKHFILAIQADLQSQKMVRDRVVIVMTDLQREEFLMLKRRALREIRLVSESTLSKIHPGLPSHIVSEYIPALENIIRNLSSIGGNLGAEEKGVEFFNAWVNWWNANKDAASIP
jgi:hypothetical protein